MRQDPLLASIGGMLRKFKRAEAWLRQAGLPTFLAQVPVWLLCVHYCIMMEGKTRRITRIALRIARWLETITELSRNDKARLELIDIDSGMRNDIESTKRTLLLLREVCVDVGALFASIGFQSRMLNRTQGAFMAIVDESCGTATTLQKALETHDARALALLRELHEQERAANAQAMAASAVDVAAPRDRNGGEGTGPAGTPCEATVELGASAAQFGDEHGSAEQCAAAEQCGPVRVERRGAGERRAAANVPCGAAHQERIVLGDERTATNEERASPPLAAPISRAPAK